MDNSRIRNLAVLVVLMAVFTVPAIFLNHDLMLDGVSFLMLAFGISGLYLITEETWAAFWAGSRDRASLALYGLFSLFLSVVMMRSYGILTRNVEGAGWLQETHLYAGFVAVQLTGLWLFSKASAQGVVPTKQSKWGQLIVGIIIGALVASSKAVEPILMFLSKLFGRIF